MPREHANIRLDMWGDSDWRSLTRDAQWLYELLLTHPDTNRAGVSDWRPGRLAQMCTGTTAADVKRMGTELERKHFIVIDEDSEEVLVRSYVKYDGVLKQPNLAITMAADWTGVASQRLRGVIAYEVQQLRIRKPELAGWKSEQHLATLLSSPAINVKSDPSTDPSVHPSGDPKPKGGGHPSTEGPPTTTGTETGTKTSSSMAKRRETGLPDSWAPTAAHIERAKTAGIDVVREAEAFRLHAETHDRRAANWNAAFTTWLIKAPGLKGATGSPATRRDSDAWMQGGQPTAGWQRPRTEGAST